MNEQFGDGDGMLAGLGAITDAWLGLVDPTRYGKSRYSRYKARRAATDLAKKGGPLAPNAASGGDLVPVQRMLDQIDSNWRGKGSKLSAKGDWQMRRALEMSPENTSPEVILERLVVALMGDTWSNQIPTCGEGRRAIDLGHDCGDGEFELIELKFGSEDKQYGTNHPLFAAIEIFQYGLLYIHARQFELGRGRRDASPLLKARIVHLRVLAPSGYYRYKVHGGEMKPYDFRWLEQSLNAGLSSLDLKCSVDFQFQQFKKEFDSIYFEPLPLATSVSKLRKSKLECREPVYAQQARVR